MNFVTSMSRDSKQPNKNLWKPVYSELFFMDSPLKVATISSIIWKQKSFDLYWDRSYYNLKVFGKLLFQHFFICFNKIRGIKFCFYFWCSSCHHSRHYSGKELNKAIKWNVFYWHRSNFEQGPISVLSWEESTCYWWTENNSRNIYQPLELWLWIHPKIGSLYWTELQPAGRYHCNHNCRSCQYPRENPWLCCGCLLLTVTRHLCPVVTSVQWSDIDIDNMFTTHRWFVAVPPCHHLHQPPHRTSVKKLISLTFSLPWWPHCPSIPAPAPMLLWYLVTSPSVRPCTWNNSPSPFLYNNSLWQHGHHHHPILIPHNRPTGTSDLPKVNIIHKDYLEMMIRCYRIVEMSHQ